MFDWIKPGSWQRRRQTVLVLGLLAMAIQCFVVQTHIHISALEDPTYQAGSGAPHDKYPAGEDPANCPLCQEITHFGHALAPAPALLSLPVAVAIVAFFAVSLSSYTALFSHPWHSRAPPRL